MLFASLRNLSLLAASDARQMTAHPLCSVLLCAQGMAVTVESWRDWMRANMGFKPFHTPIHQVRVALQLGSQWCLSLSLDLLWLLPWLTLLVWIVCVRYAFGFFQITLVQKGAGNSGRGRRWLNSAVCARLPALSVWPCSLFSPRVNWRAAAPCVVSLACCGRAGIA